jgi:hypothetical protein
MRTSSNGRDASTSDGPRQQGSQASPSGTTLNDSASDSAEFVVDDEEVAAVSFRGLAAGMKVHDSSDFRIHRFLSGVARYLVTVLLLGLLAAVWLHIFIWMNPFPYFSARTVWSLLFLWFCVGITLTMCAGGQLFLGRLSRAIRVTVPSASCPGCDAAFPPETESTCSACESRHGPGVVVEWGDACQTCHITPDAVICWRCCEAIRLSSGNKEPRVHAILHPPHST